MSSYIFLYPFFLFYLPVQYWLGSRGIAGTLLLATLLFGVFFFWILQKKKYDLYKPIPSHFWILYWSLIVFGEGIHYTENALNSFLLGDLDYTAQARMMSTLFKGRIFETQYYGWNENANFLSHHLSPSILLLSPFPILFGSELGFGIGVFFFSAITLPLLFLYLKESAISEELSVVAVLLWAGSSSFYRLGHSLHFEILIPVLFLLLLIGIKKRNPIVWIPSLILFLGVKEDLSIYLAGLSFFQIFTDKQRKREWVCIFLSSLFYFGILQPYFRSFAGNSAQRNWKEYWGGEEVNPVNSAFQYIQNPESIRQYAKGLRDLSFEWGLWNLISGWILLPFLGLYSLFRLSIHPWVREMYSYYIYPLIPFLIVILKNGAERIQYWIEREERIRLFPFSKEKKILILLVLTFFFSVYRNGRDGQYPIRLEPNQEKAEELRTLLKTIPRGEIVSAGFHLSPYVSIQNEVYPIRENRDFKKWIVLDLAYNSPYLSSDKIQGRIRNRIDEKKIEIVSQTKHFVLCKHR